MNYIPVLRCRISSMLKDSTHDRKLQLLTRDSRSASHYLLALLPDYYKQACLHANPPIYARKKSTYRSKTTKPKRQNNATSLANNAGESLVQLILPTTHACLGYLNMSRSSPTPQNPPDPTHCLDNQSPSPTPYSAVCPPSCRVSNSTASPSPSPRSNRTSPSRPRS